MTHPLLDISNVSVSFGKAPVVKNVSFRVAPGEIVGIAGESGSGKSTICRAALGLLPPNGSVSGDIRLDGKPLTGLNPAEWSALRGRDLSMIFQNPSSHLNPLQTVGSQIARPMIRHLGLSRTAAWDKAVALLEDVGIREPAMRAKSYPHELSGGMKQRVMIAAAISCAPRLLIADEPTTALDVTVQQKILELLKDLNRQRGLAIALISHDLGVLADICSRIVVMRHGEIVEEGEVRQVVTDPKHPYTRLLVNSQPGRKSLTSGWSGTAAETPLLEVKGLMVHFPVKRDIIDVLQRRQPEPFKALDGIDLTVKAGETVGIVGESGSGKSTLARTIILQNKATKGGVTLEGRPLGDLAGAALLAFRRRVQMVFQNPYDSLNPRMTALETIADEITSALDVTTQAQILDLLARLQRERKLTLLYISHDLSVVSSFCQRVYVFRSGKIVEHGPAADVLSNPREAYTQQLVASIHRLPDLVAG